MPAQSSRRPSLATISKRLGRSKKSQATASVATSSFDSSNKLGDLFMSLPHDIHTLILTLLDTADIFALRLTSRSMNNLLNDSASSITKSVVASTVSRHDVPHVPRLYPQPAGNSDLTHLLAVLRRQHVIRNTTDMLVSFVRMKMYMLRTHQQRNNPVLDLAQHPVATIFTSTLWFINHFLEHYRHLILSVHASAHISKSARSRFWPCMMCGDSIMELVNSYPQNMLLPIFHVYHLLTIHLKQSSRAPSYTGTIERALRGWSRKPPGSEQLAMVTLLGGLEELRQITVLKGTYNQRLETLKTFLIKIEESVEDQKVRDEAVAQGPKPVGGKMFIGPKGIERIEHVYSDVDDASSKIEKGKLRAEDEQSSSPVDAIPPSTLTGDLTTSHKPALHLLSEDVLSLIPALEDLLLDPLRRRIESEVVDTDTNRHLLDFLPEEERENELETPFLWLDRIVSGEGGIGGGRPGPNEIGDAVHASQGVDHTANDTDMLSLLLNGVMSGHQTGAASPAQQPLAHAPPPQQQQGPPPGYTAAGRLASQGMFSEFRRSVLVTVDRHD
ncbi:uncharacterized protein AB675_3739 [Cyphellophora attinorum]|uniref:F-box domain-containing protein n=1 Tax=Cyphellophora attinorum TaxID=1664694 RepID=A0A0N1H3B3_9EURO|nr:uncharacterized protein AB675_3739 [Phialophora attinorum]KPI35292.1 hypothetical protein AB675_3739 [Phialophora attinorum]